MRIAATTISVSVLALAVVATAGARTLGSAEAGRPLSQGAVYLPRPLVQAYRPVRDAYLSMILGLGVNVFSPSLDHRASGYADPNAPQRSVDLSVQTYDGIAALRFFGNQGLV